MSNSIEAKSMFVRVLIIFFTLGTFFISVTHAYTKEFITSLDTVFLNKLNSIQNEEKSIDLMVLFARKKSEKVRITLESIAANTKQKGRIRMQAICSLDHSATSKSVPILLDILETDLKQRRGFWACAIPILGSLKDRRAIPLLLHIANLNEDHLIGMNHMAIKAVASFGDEKEVSFLSRKAYILPVRFSVIKGLARIASIQSIDVLIEALQEAEELETVRVAESGLLKISKSAIPKLKKSLKNNKDKKFRSRIETLIRQINRKEISKS